MAEQDKPQSQPPGAERQMRPRPQTVKPSYRGSDKLKGKAALITGGDSGMGRAVAVLFAREEADVAVSYLSEHSDAEETRKLVEKEGRECILLPGDVGSEDPCRRVVEQHFSDAQKCRFRECFNGSVYF